MSTNYKLQTTNSRRGAVLLIAVLMSSVMLSVGLGVYQRTYKQLVFASFWKQMQVAFAAADSGLECAMYWDTHPTSAGSCFGSTLVGWAPNVSTAAPGASFSATTSSGCVVVTVTKPSPNFRVDGTRYATFIESRGYNDCNAANPRRVERALSINY